MEDELVLLACTEIPESQSTADDYRRTIGRHQGRLTDEHIRRIILQLADWRPTKPRAKLHLTLAQWLAKEPPDPPHGARTVDDELEALCNLK